MLVSAVALDCDLSSSIIAITKSPIDKHLQAKCLEDARE